MIAAMPIQDTAGEKLIPRAKIPIPIVASPRRYIRTLRSFWRYFSWSPQTLRFAGNVQKTAEETVAAFIFTRIALEGRDGVPPRAQSKRLLLDNGL